MMTLELQNLHLEFSAEAGSAAVTALDGVSLRLAPGERLALLGASGSGKSSLLRVVAGLETPQRGRVLWNDADLASAPPHRRGFALMFQEGQLFPHRDVAGNIAYPLQIAGWGRAETAARVAELLELVELPGAQQRRIATLSGGQQQRVALARALATEPQLMFLDEPLSALDRSLRARLGDLVREILQRRKLGAILVTHDHEEAFAFADRVGLMVEGRLVQLGTPAELQDAAEDSPAARFLRGAT